MLQACEARSSPPANAARFALLWGLFHRPRWVLGTLLLILAWPTQVLALAFAPITVVQPILSTFQLALLLLARFWLGVRVGAREVLAAVAIVAGISLVIVVAPRHSVLHPPALRLAGPLVLVGIAALLAYLYSRGHQSRRLQLPIAAGLGYAWVDFSDKLLSNAISQGSWGTAAAWLAAVLAFGAIAFISEMSALQRLSPVTVGPVVGALQEPLPVLMALAGGVEMWGGGPGKMAGLAAGLLLVGIGASGLARSPAIAEVGAEPPARIGAGTGGEAPAGAGDA